jgi:hypothetical protein
MTAAVRSKAMDSIVALPWACKNIGRAFVIPKDDPETASKCMYHDRCSMVFPVNTIAYSRKVGLNCVCDSCERHVAD